MPKITYIEQRFHGQSEALIERSNAIIAEYTEQGYVLTLRQLYYQMVAREVIPNNLKSYKRLGELINNARMAGRIDWDAIEDITRELRGVPHWSTPGDIIARAAHSYRLDKWRGQRYRPEVWIEKDALRSVAERACTELDVPYLSCRGYVSQSEMWAAAQRFESSDGIPVVLHFGDHDPSGIDMTRDIRDRLQTFGAEIELHRLALNMDQVKKHRLPPNPAKNTDSRFKVYIKEYGTSCWELDALDPKTLAGMMRKAILDYRDDGKYNAIEKTETKQRTLLKKCSTNWSKVEAFLRGKH